MSSAEARRGAQLQPPAPRGRPADTRSTHGRSSPQHTAPPRPEEPPGLSSEPMEGPQLRRSPELPSAADPQVRGRGAASLCEAAARLGSQKSQPVYMKCITAVSYSRFYTEAISSSNRLMQ